MSAVYFDYNATTPVHGDILPKISEFAREFGNPSSLHRYGRESQKILETSRREILDDFKGYKLVFTSSGTEANHSLFFGVVYRRAACHTEVWEPSPFLLEMGYSRKEADTGIII
jgi:cysteine desulfurase